MILAAPPRLEFGFSRLLGDQGPTGAIDLKLRYHEVHNWFAGTDVYQKLRNAVYPPASYAILWPFLGWSTWLSARWLWGATAVVALGWLAYLIVRESRADTLLEHIFVGLLPFSMYATSVAVGNGQPIVPLLPALVAGLVLLHGRRRGWRGDLLAAGLILMTLVSPTNSAPFFWIVVLVPQTLWPAVLVSLGYGALTLLAVSFQSDGPVSLVRHWSLRAGAGVSWGSVHGGYANLHSWLAALGQQTWDWPASLLVLAALGVWTCCHRHAELWILLGVAALVSRLWTYHRLYDDLLIVLPMITLFRVAKQSPSADGSGVIAGVLVAAGWVAVLSPPGLLLQSPPWNWLFEAEQTAVWAAMLIFLLNQARREKIPRRGETYARIANGTPAGGEGKSR
jgi:hypothetical protein